MVVCGRTADLELNIAITKDESSIALDDQEAILSPVRLPEFSLNFV